MWGFKFAIVMIEPTGKDKGIAFVHYNTLVITSEKINKLSNKR
jgi:hypothetical protein